MNYEGKSGSHADPCTLIWCRRPTCEEQRLRRALTEAEGSPSRAAAILGVTRMTVHRRMKKYGVEITRTIKAA